MRTDYKIKFTDKSKANLWIHMDMAKERVERITLFERVDFFLYSFLYSFPKYKYYSDSLQTFVAAEVGFDLTQLMVAVIFTCQI